jgi:hypothetical protein
MSIGLIEAAFERLLFIDYQEKKATNNLQMELPRLLPIICQTILYFIDSCVI